MMCWSRWVWTRSIRSRRACSHGIFQARRHHVGLGVGLCGHALDVAAARAESRGSHAATRSMVFRRIICSAQNVSSCPDRHFASCRARIRRAARATGPPGRPDAASHSVSPPSRTSSRARAASVTCRPALLRAARTAASPPRKQPRIGVGSSWPLAAACRGPGGPRPSRADLDRLRRREVVRVRAGRRTRRSAESATRPKSNPILLPLEHPIEPRPEGARDSGPPSSRATRSSGSPTGRRAARATALDPWRPSGRGNGYGWHPARPCGTGRPPRARRGRPSSLPVSGKVDSNPDSASRPARPAPRTTRYTSPAPRTASARTIPPRHAGPARGPDPLRRPGVQDQPRRSPAG